MPLKDREKYNEYMREYMIARYYRWRQEAITHLGGKCVDCGSVDGLELDHVDRTTKTYNISKQTLSKTAFWAEIEKCVLRCDPCHNARTAEQLSVGHGGGKTGKKNCYCDKCAPLKRAYQNANRKSRAKGVVS